MNSAQRRKARRKATRGWDVCMCNDGEVFDLNAAINRLEKDIAVKILAEWREYAPLTMDNIMFYPKEE